MKRNFSTIIGFVFFLLGFLSLVLSLVGLKLDMLGFLYRIGPGFAMVMHLVFMVAGLSIMYVARVGTDQSPIE